MVALDMMKNKSTIARLLAEEDIHVINKKMDTAYFNIKKRELGLPIWKDEISKDEEELMVCHEIGHAIWTSMDMIDKSRKRNLNQSFVNILEDARIEKFVKRKYPGSVNLFKKGYTALATRDFFGIANEGVNSCNLIDRINLYFKMMPGVEFSDVEKVFVDRAEKLETEDEVLDLAEDLYKYMEENPETDKHDDGESGEGENGDGDSDNNESSDKSEFGDNDADGDDDASSKGEVEKDADADADDTKSSADNGASTDDAAGEGSDTSDGSEVGGNATSSAPAGIPEAKTDTALKDGLKSLADGDAVEKVYARIPKIDSSKFIVDYKTVVAELGAHYGNGSDDTWVAHSLGEVKEFKNDSKKTVNYMVKEFEMKKSADQYARAATAKTGTLDMGALHTYKFNDDLFKKVTTLPGATNHGMVMVLDWSGSMCDNLKGTIEQLLQLVMFCRRTKIPFEVFAFTSCYNRDSYDYRIDVNYGEVVITENMRLLNFFSSKMSAAEEEKMMHHLWMIAKRYGNTYECWRTIGYPLNPPANYALGGTPLNDAIIVLMDFLPKYKKDSGVQKINTIFLTDGASNPLSGVKDNNDGNDFYQSFHGQNLLIDPVTNKRHEFNGNRISVTNTLLKALKGRVPGMNVVGFFLAGSGRKGSVSRRTWHYILRDTNSFSTHVDFDSVDRAMAEMRKNKVVVLESNGYDQYYILPGGEGLAVENDGLDDNLAGASKAKLKTAFAKSNKGRIQSRVLLNKFVALVA